MYATLTLDDKLLAKAQALMGFSDQQSVLLIQKALEALIERESARRLALLGGSEPSLEPIHRRRTETE